MWASAPVPVAHVGAGRTTDAGDAVRADVLPRLRGGVRAARTLTTLAHMMGIACGLIPEGPAYHQHANRDSPQAPRGRRLRRLR